MRKRLLSLIMAICMVFSLIPAVSAEEAPVTVTVAGQENAAYAAGVFDLVNEARAENGAEPYTRNATLSELAMQRAAEIALYFSHTRPDGTDCFTILDGAYTGWYNCGENIAINQRSPEAVMESWMNSDGHRGNILNTNFTQIGIGCFYTDGVYCWVQLFGNSTTDTAETTETGTTQVMADIRILPSNLSVETVAAMDLEMRPGETHTMIIEAVNPEFTYSSPALIVEPGNATDEDGTIIATRTVDSIDGSVVITAVNPGTAVMEIPVYEGQPDPVTIKITVPDEGTDDPSQPTEPEPTESVPTEPHPTEPEPTKPQPTEPEPTEPEPTEPQPTEPQPTAPEPSEPQPTEPEPTEPEPTEPDDGIIASGECGERAVWELDEDGVLTICGVGAISQSTWGDYADQVRQVVVEDGITSIPAEAFSHFTALISVDLPDSVTRIGYCAFENCTALVSIILPQGIELIDLGCLRGCTSLVSVVIPNGVTMISDDAFGGCTGLQAIVIPDSVTYIEFNAFMGCPDLTIYCYERSVAHVYAAQNDYAFQLMDDDPNTPTYSIHITTNSGGFATITPNPSPANRYVLMEAVPDKGYILDQAYYLCASAPDTELEFQKVGDNQYMFLMPASDVILEICFLATESPFSDVKAGAFYYEPVLWAVSYDITSGMGNGRFAPGNPCTRAQVVTFLWRAAGEPEPVSTRNPFTDVKESAYYYKAVLWAVENGITTGMSATSFAPNNPCTRGQVVTFLHRAAGGTDPVSSINPFRDVASSAFYYDAVLWAVENGITAGMSNTTFAPNSTCTRGQVVTFLYRFLR